MLFPARTSTARSKQMRLNPQNVQNMVTYNVVMDVSNPEQKLKPGMTANLTITIDERNNVLKVPNAALRFTPQGATGQKAAMASRGAGNAYGQGRRQGGRQQSDNANGPTGSSSTGQNGTLQAGAGEERKFAPPTAPVLA